MPRSKTGAKRTPVCKEDLERAVEAVTKHGKTAYSAAKEFNVDKVTLLRHVKKYMASGLTKVFTDAEETLVVDYILKASHLNYGLTLKNVMKLAYQFGPIGRPKGKSLILTDTPDKQRIESQKLAKASKGVKKVTRVFKPKVVKKKLTYPSSSESDVDEPDNLCADAGLSNEDFADLEDPDNENIDVGCFILVKICSKKTVKYFAAEVISLSECFYEVKYLKKDVNSHKFTREDPETYELDKNDVLFKLPHPVLSGGSERQLQKLSFGVDLSHFKVE